MSEADADADGPGCQARVTRIENSGDPLRAGSFRGQPVGGRMAAAYESFRRHSPGGHDGRRSREPGNQR